LVGLADPVDHIGDPESARLLLSAKDAPMITSARPSPLTSPAPATELALKSDGPAPSMRVRERDR